MSYALTISGEYATFGSMSNTVAHMDQCRHKAAPGRLECVPRSQTSMFALLSDTWTTSLRLTTRARVSYHT
jgi:hypothetical protein